MTKHIVAMGGGGFLEEPDNHLLDDYIFGLAEKAEPRVLFIATAGGDPPRHIEPFYATVAKRVKNARHLPLFERVDEDLRSAVLQADVVYVGGGSTLNLLAVWRAHGLDDVLKEAYETGVVLAGVSAGMNCWFDASITDSYSLATLGPLDDGLGWLSGGACPHYDGDEKRRPTLHRALLAGFPDTWAADEGAALHFVDGEMVEVVSSRLLARAYRVYATEGEVIEQELVTRYLACDRNSRDISLNRQVSHD